MDKVNRRKTDNIALFSIGVKLVTIVTLIVLVSLGSITALVSWLVRQDLRIAAEDSNFEANRRSAAEAEDTLFKISSDSLMLIYTINEAGADSSIARNATAYFFRQNPRMAALFFTAPDAEKVLINEQFFFLRDVDPARATAFFDSRRADMRRAASGETQILNAAPYFTTHLLAMFFPGETGGVAALFSPDNLNTSFGSGLNQSWMINSSGDVLVHSDFEYIRNGVNVANRDFIRAIQESPSRSKQSLVVTDFGVTRNNAAGDFSLQQLREKPLDVIQNVLHNVIQLLTGKDDTIRQFLAYTKLGTGGCTVITAIEYDKVFEGIAATTRRNIYLTIAVLSFSIMLIWFFSKSISGPLKNLAAVARKIEGGTFDLEVSQIKRRDEIGVLNVSFQKMCSALRIFGRFTNKEIAVKAMRGEIKPGGLPKHATIFFSDIRGFTEKSENFTKVFGEDASDKIVYWLNAYFSKMVECVERTSGTIDKFIGDAVMAHWGTAYTTGSPAQDAYNCVAAALLMRKALYEMNQRRMKGNPGDPPIRIGCGINTGIVTAGQLGSDVRMEYTVIGDPVNLASRIEALNKPLGTDILISEDTWKLVRTQFITEEMPSVTVKGKAQPVRIFAVINFTGNKMPKNIAEVRRLLGIQAPDITKVDVNAHEEKYTIGDTKREK
ncbi:MAG: adenylate/guanylate cyclase domain-containing protein [Treponema sp.]|nr:adenylate/guanylate cyclase domain-containing protein [Treponema sp.]